MRRRIVRLTVALAAVTIVIFGVPLAVGVAQYLLADQYSQLERLAGASVIAVSGDLAAPAHAPAGVGPDTQIGVYDDRGVRISGVGPDRGVPLVTSALTGVSSSGTLDSRLGAAAPVSDGDTIVGAVLVTAGRAGVYLRIGLIWLVMLALAGAALLLAWAAGPAAGHPPGRPAAGTVHPRGTSRRWGLHRPHPAGGHHRDRLGQRVAEPHRGTTWCAGRS